MGKGHWTWSRRTVVRLLVCSSSKNCNERRRWLQMVTLLYFTLLSTTAFVPDTLIFCEPISEILVFFSILKLFLIEILFFKKKVVSGTLKLCEPTSEILDTRTRLLLSEVEDIGYVLSNQIVSAAIAQISEARDMNQVLGELLRADGCEVHIYYLLRV